MAHPEIIHAYRTLYRTGLLAIRHSKPARYTLLAHLRRAFRNPASGFSAPHVANTVQFLRNAAAYQGLEHRVVRNLMHVWRTREKAHVPHTLQRNERDLMFRKDAYGAFDRELDMLNKTMGMCIK